MEIKKNKNGNNQYILDEAEYQNFIDIQNRDNKIKEIIAKTKIETKKDELFLYTGA